MKKLNKKNFCKLMIWFQDYGDLQSNAAATKALKEFGINRKMHQKLTGNPNSAYETRSVSDGACDAV